MGSFKGTNSQIPYTYPTLSQNASTENEYVFISVPAPHYKHKDISLTHPYSYYDTLPLI